MFMNYSCLIIDYEVEPGIPTAKHFKMFDLLLMYKAFFKFYSILFDLEFYNCF